MDYKTFMLNFSEASLYRSGINFVNNINNPNIVSLPNQTAFSFTYRLLDGTIENVTGINPNSYESIGKVAVPNNKFTNQRIFLFPSGIITAQYGQTLYDKLFDAVEAVRNEPFLLEDNIKDNAVLLCVLSVQQGTTDLTNNTQARFTQADQFGKIGIGGGGNGGISTLQSAYDNETDGTITLDGTKPFGVNDGLENPIFRILNNNKVGIGTSTPEVGLEVVDSSSGHIFHVKNQKNFGDIGDVSNSFPIGRFTVNQITDDLGNPSDLNRGLEIGAPSGGVTGPVYLKVSGTSNDFRILDNSNNQNLTIKSSGTKGGEPYFGFSEINPLRKYVLATDRPGGPGGQSATLLALYNRNFDNADTVLSFRNDISGNNSDGDPYNFAETAAIGLDTFNFDTSGASHGTDLKLYNFVDDTLTEMIELNHNNYVNIRRDLCMNDNLINDVSGINFSDGTYIGQGNSFDISTSQILKVKNINGTTLALNDNRDFIFLDGSRNIDIPNDLNNTGVYIFGWFTQY